MSAETVKTTTGTTVAQDQEEEPTVQTGRPAGVAPAHWGMAEAPYPRDLNVAQLFEAQVARNPEVIALVWGEEELNYREVNTQANQLAHHLRRRGVGAETAVGIYMERSPRLIIGLIAICKAGGCYLPLDTTYPRERLGFMIQDAQAQVIITEAAMAKSLPAHEADVICLEDAWPVISKEPEQNLSHVATGGSRAYIMYTSGSTGSPKGIEILHRGIARLVMNTNYVQLGPDDRVAQISNCAFDASTWEIWGTLLNGAQLIGVNKDLALSPPALAAQIERRRITAMFLTTALFHLMAKECPTAFRNVRDLLVGGETLSPHWAREVMRQGPPQRLINAYGPTESTTFAAWRLIESVPDDAASIPIGKPLQNTRLHILDHQLRPSPVGEIGELYIGGDGLARGYVNRPDLTREKFIDSPFHPGERLYKTGDLARWLPEGAIDFVGRADFQVKIRGFRIELDEIQTVIRRSPAVSDATVLAREDTPGDKRLVAFVAPKNKRLIDADKGELGGVTDQLRGLVKESLPDYMVPAYFLWLRELPLTPNGKVDRAVLLAMKFKAQETDAEIIAPTTPTEVKIAGIWNKLLGVTRASVHDNFFELGGNSLLAAQLALRLQEALQIKFPIGHLYEEPTIAQLARRLDELRAGAIAPGAESVDLRADCSLDEEIRPERPWTGAARNIFLTGATGFLGAFLLHRLINQTDSRIYCLVRARGDEEGWTRIRAALQKYELSAPSLGSRVVPILGDLTKTRLGFDEERFDRLARQIDVIYHNAAHVSYIEPYSMHRPANVIGTREVLRLACRRAAKPVHYVSTIGLFGPVGYLAGVTDIDEGSDIDLSEESLQMDMGYSMSKWVAEKLVFIAKERGLPVSVYRPGFIMGDSGAGVTNVDDFMSRLIVGCVEMGCYPDLPSQRKEFVPVDYVSDAIVYLSRRPSALGKTFHLVPPNADQSVDFVEFFEMIKSFGYQLKRLPYAVWKDALCKHVQGKERNPLLPLVAMLTEKIYRGALTRWELHEKMPRFHCHNTNAALKGSSVVCRSMDRQLLATYLGYLIRRELLPTPETPAPFQANTQERSLLSMAASAAGLRQGAGPLTVTRALTRKGNHHA
jgi:amino acid adenylation domain-containing protein/thioester reductase-like protein